MAGTRGKAIYGTAAWKRLRRAALQAANWRCARCHRYGTEAHHLVPLASGGPALPPLAGLEILCRVVPFSKITSRQRVVPGTALTRSLARGVNGGMAYESPRMSQTSQARGVSANAPRG